TMNPLLAEKASERQVENSGAKLVIDDPLGFVAEAPAGGEPAQVDVGPGDLAVLPYSSGTTGLMKGVMLTHRNLVANIEQAWSSMPIADDDVLIAVLPFFHIYGQTVVLHLR